ncbi:hypothetical protein B0H13DRAFT_307678 [Mycena leptocephala]|nr:hypothetical protein B0H13DRAFT_307678 [Mycena leptocephala]
MGINFFGEHEQNPPEVSSITRHQILVWVSDSSLRSKIRGLQVLIANELPSIRRESPICKTENLEVDLKTDPLSLVSTSKSVGDETAGAFSSALIEKKNKSIFNQVRDTAKALLKYKPSLPQVTLTPHEGVSRGWDVNNYRWRNAIFPDLDQDFRRANNSSLIAFSISPLPHPK